MRGTSLSSTESLSYFTSSSKKELSLDLHWQLGAKAHSCCHCFFITFRRKSSTVALESTSINFIFFFRPYYLFNQYIKNRQENFATGNAINYNIPTAKDDNSNCER